VSIKARLKH